MEDKRGRASWALRRPGDGYKQYVTTSQQEQRPDLVDRRCWKIKGNKVGSD